jgi:hypothetical protein
MVASPVGDRLLRTEVGYAGAAALLAVLLTALYRSDAPASAAAAISR